MAIVLFFEASSAQQDPFKWEKRYRRKCKAAPTPRDILQISFNIEAEMDGTKFWEGLESMWTLLNKIGYLYIPEMALKYHFYS